MATILLPNSGPLGLCVKCKGFLVPGKPECPFCGHYHTLNSRGEPVDLIEVPARPVEAEQADIHGQYSHWPIFGPEGSD